MKEEFNNQNLENLEDNKAIDDSNKRSKYIATRKRKELVNTESDDEENKEDPNNIIQKEESALNERAEYFKETIKSKYEYNKYNTIDKSYNNKNDNSNFKTNTSLQEKLKKIFMNRDKVKFQYAKQDIPDNLKYHSDESEESENGESRKSKVSKRKSPLVSSTKKDKSIVYSKQRENTKSSNRKQNSELKLSNSRNEKNDDNFEENGPSAFDNDEKVTSVTKDEVIKYPNQERKISNNEGENKKSNKKNSANKYERSRIQNKYSITHSNNKSSQKTNEDNQKENEEEESTKKEKSKTNILLKVFQKFEKKEEITKKDTNDVDLNQNNNEENENKLDKKQKLLKLLIQKKNSNEFEEEKNNSKERENEDSPKKDSERKKEDRRKKIIDEIQNLSNQKNKEIESDEKRENSFREENEEREEDDKGTYIPNQHKNKLTISIKPKSRLIKQISSSSLEEKVEEKDNKKEKEKEEIEEKPKNKKTNALINILKKLNKKKTEEHLAEENNKEDNNNKNNDNNNEIEINEEEIEKEAEKIRKKERKMQERKMAKEFQKKRYKSELDREQEDDSNTFNSQSNNKRNQEENMYGKESEIKKEEMMRRKKLKEDLKTEINDLNKEDESTVNNSSKSNLINSQNTQLTNFENEEKSRQKDLNSKPTHKKNVSTRNNIIIDQGAAPNEIIVNGMPKGNLDKSFDNSNTYVKRKIPTGKNAMKVYKPRKADIRGRSQEKVINDYYDNNPTNVGFEQNNNNKYPRYRNIGNNKINRVTYMRKKTSMNENNDFVMNNHSFCEYKMDNNEDNMDMEIEVGGGLNSSFDAYMQMQMDVNNNYENNFVNRNQNQNNNFYGTAAKNFNNNKQFNRVMQAPPNNINYMRGNSNNNIPRKRNINNLIIQDEINRSYGYTNNNYNKNNNYLNSQTNYNNITNNYNNDMNKQTNYLVNNKNSFYKQGQYITYNNYNPNSSYYNNSPPKQFVAPSSPAINNSNFNNYYQNSPNNFQRYTPNKNNDIYSNDTPRNHRYERNTQINIEDLMVLEEKLNEIIIALNKSHFMHNECFEFWNYYYNCSFYGKLETLFKSEEDQDNVQLSIKHLLISVMICYDFSFEIEVLNNEFSILIDILSLNHRNLIIIYEHILSIISSESKYNPWVFKLRQMVNNFNKMDDINYISNDGRILNTVEKIMYNLSIIIQNIRVLLKNYKTRRIECLTSIFKKIGEKTYEEINSFFRDNILRVENVKGSVLASVFLKENQYFKTEPAPYIKTKNRKPYSLILDLDETLVHFKVNSEDDSEGVLQIRPGVMPFLELVGKFYELIIFTAATQDYGDLLIDAIEENNVYFEHRFYRQHTVIMGNDFIKDLTRVGRPLDKIIIVDNMPQNFRLQKENGINIKAFWGEDVNDNALEELGKILVNIAKDGGDVRNGLEKYRDEIVKKVTSNISRNNY